MSSMRKTIIDACNMTQARANTTNDHMLQYIACALVIAHRIDYDELDSDVWPEQLYIERCSDCRRLFFGEDD